MSRQHYGQHCGHADWLRIIGGRSNNNSKPISQGSRIVDISDDEAILVKIPKTKKKRV